MVVILGNLQGHPIIISNQDDKPYDFRSMEKARDFCTGAYSKALEACDNVVIVDVKTGETETF